MTKILDVPLANVTSHNRLMSSFYLSQDNGKEDTFLTPMIEDDDVAARQTSSVYVRQLIEFVMMSLCDGRQEESSP